MNFTKMHGLGNDFVIIEAQELKKTDLSYEKLAQKFCDRNFGVGADGLIIVNPPDVKSNCDINWRIFNSDGSEPQMCGNGIRCFARYVYEKGLIKKKKFSVCTLAGEIIPEILDNNQVKVDMGMPKIELVDYFLDIGEKINITTVNMGNPHCVLFTKADSAALARSLGPKLEVHELFPEKTNVEIVKIISKDKIRVDVWERGCGITLACGTGACASAVAAARNNLTENKVEVELPGGTLYIEWLKDVNKIFMTGGAEFVFTGNYLN
ncbi:MAG: diaminopimelate epimerase [Candidatus Melainabacteria bacterium GWF2_37_15]|nr:MAG: diaminopimelate epimerase [Candidatus Melainabacteria bacterium GWF2_37_15]